VVVSGFWIEVPESLWREFEPLAGDPPRRFRYPGRKRYEPRLCLEGILTVLRWGLPWHALPASPGRPSGKTCWRRLDQWQRQGVWPQLVAQLLVRLFESDEIEWERALLDSTIVAAKRGAPRSAKTLQIAAVQRASCT
jgi:transposase